MISFPYTIIRKDVLFDKDLDLALAQEKISALEALSKEQQFQITRLRKSNEQEKLRDIIDIDIGDPTPDSPDARKGYIGRVAGFHKDILLPKCLQMISIFHRLLEEETNDKETDLYLKIGIYICREWMKWGNQAIAEQIGYQTEPPPTPAEMKEEIITQVKL